MRILPWVLTIVAVVGLTVGQPLCCVVGGCCGQPTASEAKEARAPRGVDAPCCKRCAANAGEHEGGAPADPAAPREKCECAKKQAHLTEASAEIVSLDTDLLAIPVAHQVGAPAPVGAFVIATAGRSPPEVASALTLPLLL